MDITYLHSYMKGISFSRVESTNQNVPPPPIRPRPHPIDVFTSDESYVTGVPNTPIESWRRRT